MNHEHVRLTYDLDGLNHPAHGRHSRFRGALYFLATVAAFILFAATASLRPAHADQPDDDALRNGHKSILRPVSDAYVEAVTRAARDFIGALDADQTRQLASPFDSPNRTSGPDTSHTPVFCAVLAWCTYWGLSQCSLSFEQRQALTRLLSTALSDSAYQTVRAVLNSHRLIGELEDVADASFVGKVARKCPTLEVSSIFKVPAACLPEQKYSADYLALGGAAPTDNSGGYKVVWQWPGNPPGFMDRYRQFCDHNIAFFGQPGSDRWAFRFEGHHLTINVTFMRDPSTNRFHVAMTPLFLGSFPIIVPPSPRPKDARQQLTWETSQELLRTTLDHARRFIEALPKQDQTAAFVPASEFKQAPPLRLVQFPNWLLSSTLADATAPPPLKPIRIKAGELPESARWHLRFLFRRYFNAMHPEIGDQYKSAFDRLIDGNETVSILWAGDSQLLPDGSVFLYVSVGPLLLELNASNEWSTQHRSAPKANHLHSMLRDMSFRWGYDASFRPPAHDHHKHDHGPPANPAGAR